MSEERKYDNKDHQSKARRIFLDFQPSLNRAIVVPAFCGQPINFAIKYDKKTTALQFQPDSGNPVIRSGKVKIMMFRNTDNCKFCNVFFNLENVKNDNSDFRGKFIGLNPNFSRHIIQFSKERYDFHINDKPNKSSQNSMVVSGWKIQDSDNDLLFYFVQRKCYNDVTRTNVIRTAAIQFATTRGIMCLEHYYDASQNTIRKVDPTKDDLPDFLVGGNMTPYLDSEKERDLDDEFDDEDDDGDEFDEDEYEYYDEDEEEEEEGNR